MNEIDLPEARNGHRYIFRFDDDSLLELAEVCQEWTQAAGLETDEAVEVIEAADFAIRRQAMKCAVEWRRGRNLEALKGK